MAMCNSCNIPRSGSNDNSSLNLLICQLHRLYAEGPSPAAVVAPACLQTGEFDQIAARISAAVKLNCGQKAVILAHSMGGNVMLHLMRQPRFEGWRCVGGLPYLWCLATASRACSSPALATVCSAAGSGPVCICEHSLSVCE
jgi:hypothetical protein